MRQTGVVVVLPADNVELIPDAKAILGLVRQQIAAPLDLPARQQTPLVYRGEPGKERLCRRHSPPRAANPRRRDHPARRGRARRAGRGEALVRDRLRPGRSPAAGRSAKFGGCEPLGIVRPGSAGCRGRPAGQRRRSGPPGPHEGGLAAGVDRALPADGPLSHAAGKAGCRETDGFVRPPDSARRGGTFRREARRPHGGGASRGRSAGAVDGRRRGCRAAARRAQPRADRREAVAAPISTCSGRTRGRRSSSGRGCKPG